MLTKSYLLSSAARFAADTGTVHSAAEPNVDDMTAFQVVDAMVERVDDQWQSLADTYMDDREWTKIGAVPLAVQSLGTFGFDLIAAFPPLNSAPPSKDKHRGPILHGNVPTDWYPKEKVGRKSKKPSWASHSADLASRIPLGQRISKQVADIAAADVGDSKKEKTGPYKDMAPEELEAMKNHWKPRVQNLVSATREALAICKQLAALTQCKNVYVKIKTTPVKQARVFVMPVMPGAPWDQGTEDAPEYLYATNKPFAAYVVQNLGGGRMRETFQRGLTVRELLAWDVQAAGGVDATIKSLDETAKREPEPPSALSAIDNVKDAEEYEDELFAFWDKKSYRDDAVKIMKRASGKDLLTVTWRLYERWRHMFSGDAELRELAQKAIDAEDSAESEGEHKAA